MADSATRAQRAAALEEKRRKLEELKKRRNRRDDDVKKTSSSNLDEYIDGLLGQPNNGGKPGEEEQVKADEAAPAGEKEQKSAAVSVDDNRSTQSSVASNVIAEAAPAPPPKIIETFTVATQTEVEDFPETSLDEEESGEKQPAATSDEQQVDGEHEAHVVQEEEPEPKILTEKEIEKEVKAATFSSFINTASKKVERMLGTELSELLVDYIGETDGEKQKKDADESRFLSSRQVYQCDKWTEGRDITDIDWSPMHRDFCLATYHMKGSVPSSLSKGSAAVSAVSPNDTLSSSLTPRSGELQSDGLALIWSLAMPSRPEHIFTCGSPVTTGRFHPTESTLVIGGCESGQLVVWDVRAGRLPVQKSSLTTVAGASSKGHTYPINGMEIIEGGLGLATTSTDGRLNFWSLSNLRDPVESLQVSDSISCFTVVPESEGLLLGDDNGALYSVSSSQGQRSSRKQVRKLDSVDESGENFGHYGMVTSLSSKTLKKGAASRAAGLSKGFLRGSGGLILSSGVDWTVKLWAPAYSDRPLASMVSHSYDYMSDVQWCPSHPSVFATASSNGSVGLWNIVNSLDEPLTGQEGLAIETDAESGRGLNKLKWSADCRRLSVACGDRLHVLNLTDEVTRPKGDEDGKLMNHLIARGLISRQ